MFLFTTKSQATGSISLNGSKSSVEVGDEFNISVNLSGASVATLTARITVDTNKVEYVSGPANTNFSNGKVIYTWTDPTGGSNPKTDGVIATFKFKAKASGTASFSVNGDFYSADEVSLKPSFTGTSVVIKEKETVTVTPTTPSTGNNQTSGNTNTSGNNSNTNNVTNTGNVATGGSNSSGNTNTGSSGNTSNTGTGSSNTQTLSTNANLKELHLSIEGLSPAFQKTITQYNIIVGNDVNQININAIPEDSNAKVSISGNTNLKTGVNQIKIFVTAQDR
jgi:hypothetical protein